MTKLIERGRKEGFPLVEKDSLFPNYVFATFFFTATARWHDVELEVFGIYDEYRLGDRKLYRIDSTGLYYRSYLFPDDLCLAYRFVLRDTVSGKRRIVSDPLNDNLSPTGERRDFSWSVLDLRPQEPDWYSKRTGMRAADWIRCGSPAAFWTMSGMFMCTRLRGTTIRSGSIR